MKTGSLGVVGPHGASWTTVRIVGQFLWFYRIEAITITRLSGYERYLLPGERTLIPKRVIRRVTEHPTAQNSNQGFKKEFKFQCDID